MSVAQEEFYTEIRKALPHEKAEEVIGKVNHLDIIIEDAMRERMILLASIFPQIDEEGQ